MKQTTLTVHTQSHDYPIFITASKANKIDLVTQIVPYIKGKQVLIVTNETIAPLYLSGVQTALEQAHYTVATCILPDGEAFKNQDSINSIYDVLMQEHFARDCTLIALGGGVIGDMTGFAAASFMRGVNFIQVPTTLLSQVDSSVGGKTGINHALGKNMIGAFWQPMAVLADMATFQTLPKREFAAGLAEVVKYALIMDVSFLDWLEEHTEQINAHDGDVLAKMVYRCCDYKAKIVALDERESGKRALLNFGHTFGHAIETHQGYGAWLHGEAVAVGMVQALAMSHKMALISRDEVSRVIRLLQAFNLPIVPPKIDVNDALTLMGHDKKVQRGQIRLVLLRSLGDAFVTADFEPEMLMAVLSSVDEYVGA
ncbi:3-dehydroquinate synthase [Moraxella nasovis]|uniref:3-dehydroquinate synthase n=1 Tax=Moraxella nasovis TaxID=2904121 RepID=UPI001F609DCD|nr:3-dehydroquinate synthase [Moraxella nasovis]UNU72862.1 3-dehydroquinate synthase [Moraxella nasovis]